MAADRKRIEDGIVSESFIYRAPAKTKRERISRLRRRLDAAETTEQLRSVMQGLLDLLGDEL